MRPRRVAQDVGPSGTYPNESGLVLVLNYIHFPDPKAYREGAERDGANIRSTFTDLNYIVEYHEDLSKPDTLSVLENMRQDRRLELVDSFILIINTHGLDRKTFLTSDGETHDIEKSFLTSDGETHDIELIKLEFTNTKCPVLKHKPKILLANCCRGTDIEKVRDNVAQGMGMLIMEDAELAKARPKPRYSEKELPTHMAVICSASEGIISMRNKVTGSYFIQYLCDTLRETPNTELSIVINTIADKMKLEKLHHPTEMYKRPFRNFIFKFKV
ncbi:unnamed protein product, partial [Meganyctiphanes norvegica]